MSREVHVQFCERAGVRLPCATHLIIQCPNREAAQTALDQVRVWMEAAGLTLHPEKTRIVDAAVPGGFDFLGWHFERGLKWPREKSLARFKETLREETPRNSGLSLEATIERLNRRLRGWYRYFQGGVKNVYDRLDRWLRGRLRSLLRRRAGRKGRGRGLDHNHYSNEYFAKHRLISLYASARGERSSPAVCG